MWNKHMRASSSNCANCGDFLGLVPNCAGPLLCEYCHEVERVAPDKPTHCAGCGFTLAPDEVEDEECKDCSNYAAIEQERDRAWEWGITR